MKSQLGFNKNLPSLHLRPEVAGHQMREETTENNEYEKKLEAFKLKSIECLMLSFNIHRETEKEREWLVIGIDCVSGGLEIANKNTRIM